MSRFSHISGDPTLDLLNTVEWRLSETDREEDLSGYTDVLAWCHESDLLSDADIASLAAQAERHPQDAATQRTKVIELRESAYRTLFEHDTGSAQSIATTYRDALGHASLQQSGDTWRWADDELTLATPVHRIARALIALLQRSDLDQLHQCEDDKCGWVFLDTSPRRNRRWCVTKDCGDRNRARAYYNRKKRADQ